MIDILGLLHKIKFASQHERFLTDQSTKFSRSMPFTAETCSNAANVPVDNSDISYEAETSLLTNNGPHFMLKTFSAATLYFDIENLTATA